MIKRSRSRCIATAAGALLLAAVLAVYALNWYLQLWVMRDSTLGGFGFVVADGGVLFLAGPPTRGETFWLKEIVRRSDVKGAFGPYTWWFRAVRSSSGAGRGLFVPLWAFGVPAVAMLAFGLTGRVRTRIPCAKCGYELAGLSGGVCPECGCARTG